MKKATTISIVLLLAGAAGAQTAGRQVLGTGGASFGNAALSADYTIGEAVTVTGVSGALILSQGFQQPPDVPVSVREIYEPLSWHFYPSPAQDFACLELSSNTPARLSLTLCNANGQMLSCTEIRTVNGTVKKEMDLRPYAAGIYFLLLSDAQNTFIQRIRFEKL